MSIAPGTRFGPYEIAEPIGAGGMGEVYRATDTTLERAVAIKVLPASVASDGHRIARFEQEAKTLAALNHPNIAQIYGLQRSGATTALAMELVEGPTLADRIARGPLPADEAVDVAMQIADALGAAHERGIVHRDLKPANVKLRPDGTVKVLDFGIAKALEPQEGASGPQTPSLTTPAMTQTGILLGTAAYMSPEQARGKTVDERADIWAFGCVLYEMLTGQPAFGGSDVSTTLARVLERDPAMNALPRGTPPSVGQTIRLCLKKDLRERLADIRDVKLALAGTFGTLPVARPARAAWIAAGAALLVAIVLAAALYVAPRPQEARPLRLSMSLPEGFDLATSSNLGEPTPLVVSPDGRRIAMVARRAQGQTMILMRDMAAAAARPLAGTEGATSLFWSPDSRLVGFFADGKIETVEASGGPTTVVCDAEAPFLGGTWGRDGTIVFSMPDKQAFRLFKVAAGGGRPTPALPGASAPPGSGTPDETNGNETRPWFLPDGRTLLYVAGTLAESKEVYAVRLGSRERAKIADIGSSNVQYAQGHLLFMRGAMLVAQPFDATRLAVTGDPVPVADGVSKQGAVPGFGMFSASQNGVLVYYSGAEAATATRLAWVDRQGGTLGTIGEQAEYRGIALSHDETRVAAVVGPPSKQNLFVIDLANGVSTQLTFDMQASFPVWSADDRFIDFGVASSGSLSAYRKPSNGAGVGERVLPDDKDVNLPFDRSADDALLYTGPGLAKGVDLWVLPSSGDRTPFRLAATPDDKRIGKFSPNGRWIAYVSYERSGQSVWVVPFVGHTAPAGVKWRVSGSDGGSLPLWSADGRELFYVSSSRLLTAVQVDGDGQAFQVGPARTLFPIGGAQLEGGYAGWPYAVSKDGRRFLVTLSAAQSSVGVAAQPVNVEVNWTARLGQ